MSWRKSIYVVVWGGGPVDDCLEDLLLPVRSKLIIGRLPRLDVNGVLSDDSVNVERVLIEILPPKVVSESVLERKDERIVVVPVRVKAIGWSCFSEEGTPEPMANSAQDIRVAEHYCEEKSQKVMVEVVVSIIVEYEGWNQLRNKDWACQDDIKPEDPRTG